MWAIFLLPLVTYLLYLYDPSLNRLTAQLRDLSQFSYYFSSIQTILYLDLGLFSNMEADVSNS